MAVQSFKHHPDCLLPLEHEGGCALRTAGHAPITPLTSWSYPDPESPIPYERLLAQQKNHFKMQMLAFHSTYVQGDLKDNTSINTAIQKLWDEYSPLDWNNDEMLQVGTKSEQLIKCINYFDQGISVLTDLKDKMEEHELYFVGRKRARNN